MTPLDPTALPDVPQAALDELEALYRDLDAHLAAVGVACKQCGKCCNFARNDYHLYASRLELALAVRGVPRPPLRRAPVARPAVFPRAPLLGKPAVAHKDTRHRAAHGAPRLAADGTCGFLEGGRCSIHAARPLGCRVSFCEPAHKSREQDLYHAYLNRLRALAERYAIPWDYAPFL